MLWFTWPTPASDLTASSKTAISDIVSNASGYILIDGVGGVVVCFASNRPPKYFDGVR